MVGRENREQETQREVLEFLVTGALGQKPERIETHGAVILLSADRAFKLKRAVAYSFMDFSTLEKRRTAIEAELRLNRRTAPTLYRRVLPVVRRKDGALGLGGEGEPVEWLLEMARFPADAELDRIAVRGELTPALVAKLARNVIAFHASAEVRTDKGGYAGMAAIAEGTERDFAELAPDFLDTPKTDEIVAVTWSELERHRELLDARRASGRVRHCHGDLHLANIVCLGGEPVPFDCIEFNEDLACIDVLYDVAFLVMDLLERGLKQQAQLFLQAYNDLAVEDAGLALMPVFLSMRAAVRAKVIGFAARLADGVAREESKKKAEAYLDLAQDLLKPVPPRLVVIGGRSGTGKSSVALALAPMVGAAPGAVVLRSDVVRKRLFSREPTERLPQEAYAAEVSDRVFATMAERAQALLQAGRSVVCDGVYAKVEQRQAIEKVAREARVPSNFVWLEAPEGELEARVATRIGDASDADVAVVRRQRDMIETTALDWARVEAGRPLDAVVREVRDLIEG
jgi:aminoglycoside phosphotransferase family enzyme/predicted kinase